MKLHSKFTQYLVANYPILFHSKFFHLMGISTAMWLFSFLIGYGLTNFTTLRNFSADSYYFESYFALFHFVALIVILSVWAIHFFKMKPVRNFYPLRKGYFTLLFLQLFLPFLLLISAYIPFHSGVLAKTRSLLPIEEFRKDKRTVNLGYPFLITNTEDYSFAKKAYPAPFPLDYITSSVYTSEDYDRTENYENLKYSPDFIKQEYVPESEIGMAKPLRSYFDSGDSILKMNGVKYLFYRTQLFYTNADSCSYNNLVSEIVWLSEEQRRGMTESSLQNYSNSYMTNYKGKGSSRFILGYSDYEDYYGNGYDSLFVARDLPLIYNIAVNKDYLAVEKSLENLAQVASKYGVPHRLNIPMLVDYWREKDMKNLSLNLVKTYDQSEDSYYYEGDGTNDYYTNSEKEILRQYMFVETNDFSKLNSNFQRAFFTDDFSDIYVMFLIMAFLLSSFILWFEFMEIKPFLISIPVGGVLSIVIFLIMLAANSPFSMGQSSNEILLFFILFCIFALAVYYIKAERTSRFVASILLNLGYVLVHFLLLYFLVIVNKLSRITQIDKADKCGNTISHEWFSGINSPIFFVLFGMVSVFLFYRLIPQWKAKKV